MHGDLAAIWQSARPIAIDNPPRHQTLNATFDWSYDLPAEPERAVLQRLLVLAGGLTLEEAQDAARVAAADVDEVAEIIVNLVAKSLVVTDTGLHGNAIACSTPPAPICAASSVPAATAFGGLPRTG